jgi:hypothetical protein
MNLFLYNQHKQVGILIIFVHCKYGFQSDTLVVSVVGRHIVYAGYTRKGSSSYERIKNAKIHRVMNKKNPKHVIVLLSNQKAPKRYTLIL